MREESFYYIQLSEFFCANGFKHVKMIDLTHRMTNDPGNEVMIMSKIDLPDDYYDRGLYHEPLISEKIVNEFVDEQGMGDHAISMDRFRLNSSDMYLFIAIK